MNTAWTSYSRKTSWNLYSINSQWYKYFWNLKKKFKKKEIFLLEFLEAWKHWTHPAHRQWRNEHYYDTKIQRETYFAQRLHLWSCKLNETNKIELHFDCLIRFILPKTKVTSHYMKKYSQQKSLPTINLGLIKVLSKKILISLQFIYSKGLFYGKYSRNFNVI